jgi:colanic acid biosynthesis glycosyl transferase WcaI
VVLRIFHELSFVVTSFLRCLQLPRPDVLVVVSPPLLLGAAAWLAGRIKRAPFVFHVQDLQPDAALGLGMLKPSRFARALYALESLAYRKAARVAGISQGMLDAFRQKGVPPDKLVYFPNGVVPPAPDEVPDGVRFRQRLGFSPGDFLAVYSGNLGVKQGLQVVIEAARLLKNPRVKIILCGEGSDRARLQSLMERDRLQAVTLLPMQPDADYREMMGAADVCLITQQKGSGRAFFPSKLLSALAFRKPVLTVADADSELARALKSGRFGVNIPPEEPGSVARALDMLGADPERLAGFAGAGRKFIESFERKKVLGDFIAVLETLGQSRRR